MDECAVCLEERYMCELSPCGHKFCESCINKIKACKCPFCREDFYAISSGQLANELTSKRVVVFKKKDIVTRINGISPQTREVASRLVANTWRHEQTLRLHVKMTSAWSFKHFTWQRQKQTNEPVYIGELLSESSHILTKRQQPSFFQSSS